MSQLVKKYINLDIAEKWIEPHSPWQDPSELNGVKYLNSYAQVLLDRTGAPDSDHNISANRQVDWKISEQVSKGWDAERFLYPDVLLV
jgi:hypothetical protein